MHVSLTPELDEMVRRKVDSGLYNNASEVVREALRVLLEVEEVRRLKLERLRAAIDKGEADVVAGRLTSLADDEELEEFFARL
jgi:antitoxin ParD1/3/4